MPTSVKLDIWNRALDRIGETEPVEDEDDDRLAAAICRRHFDDCLGEALELRPTWPWATRQAQLAELAGASRAGWEHVYALPADFVAARAVLTGGLRINLTPEETRVSYELQANDAGDGQVLCTDQDLSDADAFEYTSNAIAIVAMPRLFISAVVWRLAAELAMAVKKDVKLADGCLKAFDNALSVAHAASVRGMVQDDLELDAPSIRARR